SSPLLRGRLQVRILSGSPVFRTWIAFYLGLVLCVVGFPAVTGLELSLKINISGSKRRRT
ncbi:MAG: hypothetical protein ACPG6U_02905, partial [Paracoccaceae bacterium]